MKEIIKIEGKAKNVFKYVELMNKQNGNITLGELAKKNTQVKIELQ
ncbi:MAG: hypothetical protein JW712_03100 [Dehalococcoidales bacterium]|nr:hypothetical protein [Dehalococcoidales bacterium]